MNINQIKNIYLANGLDEFKIRSHSDINSVYGIDDNMNLDSW
ncbi:hypothetical protein [Ruminiclostridium cellobioparum]|nr:hypothetical protein [Ruminiclostridium cellobioparum]